MKPCKGPERIPAGAEAVGPAPTQPPGSAGSCALRPADPVGGSTEAAGRARPGMPQRKRPPPPGLCLNPRHLPDRAKSLLPRMEKLFFPVPVSISFFLPSQPTAPRVFTFVWFLY